MIELKLLVKLDEETGILLPACIDLIRQLMFGEIIKIRKDFVPEKGLFEERYEVRPGHSLRFTILNDHTVDRSPSF